MPRIYYQSKVRGQESMDCRQQAVKRLIGHNFNHLSLLPELIDPMMNKILTTKTRLACVKAITQVVPVSVHNWIEVVSHLIWRVSINQ